MLINKYNFDKWELSCENFIIGVKNDERVETFDEYFKYKDEPNKYIWESKSMLNAAKHLAVVSVSLYA